MKPVNLSFSCKAALVATALLATSTGQAADPVSARPASATVADADEKPYIRPDVAAYLKVFYAQPRPELTREVLAQLRKLPPAAVAAMSQQDLPVGAVTIKDVTMPGAGTGGGASAAKAGRIALRLFDARPTRGPGPVVVFYHGGGYVLGSIDTHAALAAEISRRLDLPVVSVEYRLAPENPWPAAPDDGEAAARWVAANGKAFDRTFTGLVLSGDSAGGNLALITSAALRDRPATLPVVMQIPMYPATDFGGSYPSARTFASGYLLDAKMAANFTAYYAARADSVRASPIRGDLSGLPPTVLVTASLDPLRDQGRAYAAGLIEAGVPTAYYEAKGLIHGFATFRKAIPSAQADTVAFLNIAKLMLEQQGVTPVQDTARR